MPVNIKIVGPPDKNEYQFAQLLKGVLQEGLPSQSSGRIVIASNVQLYGQNPRDVDLIVFGALDDTKINIDVWRSGEKKEIWLNSFCFTIEVKEHNSHGVEYSGSSLIVGYKNKDMHDVTSQSEGQKYSLKNYLEWIGKDEVIPWICNLIWMVNLDQKTIDNLLGNRPHNIFPGEISLSKLIGQAYILSNPKYKNGELKSHMSSLGNQFVDKHDVFKQLYSVFASTKKAAGALTRSSVERIVGKETVIPQDLEDALGNVLIIFSGRAGSGKTVKLLRLGCELASKKGRRCLFLTYNQPLVSDIKRTLYYADVPTDFDRACLEILTIHQFVKELGIALGVTSFEEYNTENHISLCSEIAEYIESQVITPDDIVELMKQRHELACWDHVLVDEAQDFAEEEKYLLFNFFGYAKLVIADGIDQFVRQTGKANWTRNLYISKLSEERSLRQKKNLVGFVNDYADKLNLKWQVQVVPELLGGRIVISDELIPFRVIKESREKCYAQGNNAYDILFLTPPDYVENDGSSGFKFLEGFERQGFSLWDGSNEHISWPGMPKENQHRLLQYSSCRGLEGWCVVCLGFDKMLESSYEYYAHINEDLASRFNLVAMDSEEAKRQFVGLWSLIPLTRAIDTLIITLDNPQSEIGQVLKACGNEDYVELVY